MAFFSRAAARPNHRVFEKEILEKGMICERGQKGRTEERREKSIQVFLITTAEKTARKRIKDQEKKSNPLQRRFFWFCIFQIIILWSASGCAHVSV